jgi:hypothetical protein
VSGKDQRIGISRRTNETREGISCCPKARHRAATKSTKSAVGLHHNFVFKNLTLIFIMQPSMALFHGREEVAPSSIFMLGRVDPAVLSCRPR